MKKKILVVDDEEDILHFLELVLREKGYEVVTAASVGSSVLASKTWFLKRSHSARSRK